MHSAVRLPHILITNDDGIQAPGLTLLAEIAQEFANEVWVVAPEHDQSGCAQTITLNKPLQYIVQGEKRWAVSGTPNDCIALALSYLMPKNKKPSLILSGINPGANIGDEVNLSGTVGGAFTGLMLDIPAIGISQACSARNNIPWTTSRVVVPKVLHALLAQGWRKETCLSVNIPNLPPEEITGFSWARQSHKNIRGINVEKRSSPREQDYFWLSIDRKDPTHFPNSENAILRRGEVSITALGLDRSIEVDKASVTFNETELVISDE